MRRSGVVVALAIVSSTSLAHGQAVVDATAQAERAPPGEPAVVTVGSSGPGVTLAKILNRTVGSGYASGVSVVIVGITYKDLCQLPCTVKLDPGFHELAVYGSGVTTASEKFDLGSGRHFLAVDPGSSGLVMGGWLLGTVGLGALIFGGVFLVADPDEFGSWALPVTLGGAAGAGAGIGMIIAGRTSLERVPAPPGAAARAGREVVLGYRGEL